VYLAVKKFGNCHYDEALLLKPGHAESTFGPLMDDEQALLMKNPPEVLKREPGKTFFLFTSNYYWGRFAGRGRYEQSPAMMRRMGVLCMVGEFAMTEQDELGLRMHEPPPPVVRVPLPGRGKKKALSPAPDAGSTVKAVHLAADSAVFREEHPTAEVH